MKRRLELLCGATVCAAVLSASPASPQDVSSAHRQGPSARRILASYISHGIGGSLFDADGWQDETNAQLIVQTRAGATAAQLGKIVPDRSDLDARLRKLEQQGFLRREGARVRATFPILIGRERDEYEALVSRAAARIEARMRQRWRGLLLDVAARGWAEWSYHVVWSLTMDSGFSWGPLLQVGYVPPLSHVVVWVVYPAHSFQSGTNYFPNTELSDRLLGVTWRGGAAPTIDIFEREWRLAYAAALAGAAAPEQRGHLAALGLVDSAGRVTFPVLTRRDPLYARMDSLGAEHVRRVAAELPLRRLTALAGGDARLAFAMAYHDVSWDIVRRLVAAGLIQVPPALEKGAGPGVSMAGVCGLIDAPPVFMAELKKALGIQP